AGGLAGRARRGGDPRHHGGHAALCSLRAGRTGRPLTGQGRRRTPEPGRAGLVPVHAASGPDLLVLPERRVTWCSAVPGGLPVTGGTSTSSSAALPASPSIESDRGP